MGAVRSRKRDSPEARRTLESLIAQQEYGVVSRRPPLGLGPVVGIVEAAISKAALYNEHICFINYACLSRFSLSSTVYCLQS